MTMDDRLVALCAAIAAVFYLLASLSFWLLLSTRRTGPLPFEGIDVMADRAVAWSALALMFGAIGAVKLGWLGWHQLNGVLGGSMLTVAGAGLFSVRQMTLRKFGERVWLFYLAAVLLIGGAVYLWG
jgi:hypothetical protein